jgi:hypothetical protein
MSPTIAASGRPVVFDTVDRTRVRDIAAGADVCWVIFPYCATSTSASFTVHLGVLYGQRSPIFKLIAKDEFAALASGATYQITRPNQNWSLTFQDGKVL